MTIDEMIERLEEYRDSMGGEAEVRLVVQPNWPFENQIQGMVSTEEVACEQSAEAGEAEETPEEKVVYIVEGNQMGYGNKSLFEYAY